MTLVNPKRLFDAIRGIKQEPLTQYEVDMINGILAGEEPALSEFEAPASFPISTIDLPLLKLVSRNATDEWARAIRRASREHKINTIRRVAAFIATLAHEGNFTIGGRENMNYSARRMAAVWPSRFRPRRPSVRPDSSPWCRP